MLRKLFASALALLAALTVAAGVAVRRREGNAVAEAAARG